MFLSARDTPCPRCGYNLRAIESRHCPECAARLDLLVGSPDLRLRPWITALIGTSIPAGFAALFSAGAIVTAVVDGFSGPAERNATLLFWAATLGAWGLVVLIIRGRTAFVQRRLRSQWILAVGSTLLSAIVVAGVVVMGLLYWRL